MPTVMLKALYNTNDRKENNLIVNTIKSGLSDSKDEIKYLKKKEKLKSLIRQQKLLKIFLNLINKNKKDKA